MGPVGAVSGSALKEMKEILELIADRERFQSALNSLVELRESAQRELDMATNLFNQAKSISQENEKQSAELLSLKAEIDAIKADVEERERRFASDLLSLNAERDNFILLKVSFAKEKEAETRAIESRTLAVEKRAIEAEEMMKEAIRNRDEYLLKLDKLKTAMGA